MNSNIAFWDKYRNTGSTTGSSAYTSSTNDEIKRMVFSYERKFASYDKTIEALSEALRERDINIEELTRTSTALKEDAEKLKQTVDDTYKEFKEDTQTDKSKLIEVVGIFVAIFTFISIEIQILESINGILRISGFTILLFTLLMLFLYLLNYMADNWINKSKNTSLTLKQPFFIYITSLVILSLVLIGIGDYKNPAEIKNNKEYIELKQKVETLESKNKDLESRLNVTEKANVDIQKTIEELQQTTKITEQ